MSNPETHRIPWRPLQVVSAVLAFVVGLGIFLLLHDKGELLITDLLEWLVWLLPSALLFVILTRRYPPPVKAPIRPWIAPATILFLFAVLVLFSSLTKHNWFYFLEWAPWPGADAFDPGLVRFVFLTALLAPLMVGRLKHRSLIAAAILLYVQGMCVYQFLRVTGGGPLYNDDHTSFMFRLWEFSQTYPQLRNYSPFWNGGTVGHFGTASGTTILGLPLWPALQFFEPHVLYTWALILVYIVAVPWITVGSLRIMNADRTASYIAGIFALGVSRQFFLWMLHYGTIGANFAIPFIIPVSTCLYRVFVLGKRERWLGVVLVVAVYYLLAWPLAAVALLALGPALILWVRKLDGRRLLFLVLCAAAFVALYSKNLIIILTESRTFEKHVVGVISDTDSQDHFVLTAEILQKGWKFLWAHLREVHPLLVFLGLFGVFFYPSRRVRWWFAPAIIVLLVITGWGREYFPDLQLRRMSIPLAFMAVPPAALWCSRLLSGQGRYSAFIRASLVAFLLLGGLAVSKIYRNKGYAPYKVMQPYVQELMDFVDTNVPSDGRVMFAGKTVHKYGRAHVAAFPLFTKKEFMACDYYAFSIKEVEYEYPPRVFRVPEQRVWEFMNLYNVSHIITYRSNWIRFYTGRPEQYEEVMVNEEKGIHIFKVLRPNNMFWKGSGRVEATFNRITVWPDPGATEVVVKYNWAEGFVAEEPAEVFPFAAHEHATLVGIRPNGAEEVHIRFKSRL